MKRIALLLLSLCALEGCSGLRTFFPSHAHESDPPQLPLQLSPTAVLVFTKTNGYRHKEAIPAGLARLEAIATRRGWSLVHTENGAVFNRDDLARFAVTVWHNTSGDTLSADQRTAFQEWLEAGGGFVGIHGAGGDPDYDYWPWYVESLIGAQFIGHTMGPQFQDAEVITEDRNHPATRHLLARFVHSEEWYSFDRNPRAQGSTVLLRVDESSYSPVLNFPLMSRDIAMGDDHPVVWHHCIGKGRALFSALGHQSAAYSTPEYAGLLEGAIAWAARQEGEGCD